VAVTLKGRRGGRAQDLGTRLFTFVVVADTHVNQEDGKASSDFAVNRLSNARSRHVMREINRIAPALVLHLGDIVHPNPAHPGYATAADSFHALAKELKCPLYLTPGNHDVGDKPGDWLPVPSVSDDFLALYSRHFGKDYYSLDSNGCHFVVINAQIINSGLECEAAQKSWLEKDLAAHSGKRIFLATHYPPYLYEPGEDGHYDNIDEPGRSWLLGLFARHTVEAVFAGHVHNLWYHLHGDTDVYLLPSTSFVRLDYSELCRIEPGPEGGRNDAPKLGFFQVDVHENGHVAYVMRTSGATLAPGARVNGHAERLPPVHTKSIALAPVGIDLRYPWAETVEVAASGALDEFSRKLARNDYPLMALWEMGVRRLRVPARDLANPLTRERMRVLRRVGNEFTVYTHGVPSGELRDALVAHAGLVSAWEVIAPLRKLDEVAEQVREIKTATALMVHLSKLQRPEDRYDHGKRGRHTIEHGFLVQEHEQLRELLARNAARDAFDGVSFRVARGEAAWDSVRAVHGLSRALGIRTCAYMRLASDNPADAPVDDLATANRVAETVVAAFGCPGVDVWLDTFNDVDRGYFRRSGLVDRRYNPRVGFHVYRNLHSALSGAGAELSAGEATDLPGVRVLALEGSGKLWLLLLPERETMVSALPLGARKLRGVKDAKWIDLASGDIRSLTASVAASPGGDLLRVGEGVACAVPALVRISA